MYYWVAEDGSTYHGHNSQSPISGTDASSPNMNSIYAMRWANFLARPADVYGTNDSPCVNAGGTTPSLWSSETTMTDWTDDSGNRDIGYHYWGTE